VTSSDTAVNRTGTAAAQTLGRQRHPRRRRRRRHARRGAAAWPSTHEAAPGHIARGRRGRMAARSARAAGRSHLSPRHDAVADLANRSSDYMTDPAVNVQRGLVMGNWDELAAMA
jgi:hypothetical protein